MLADDLEWRRVRESDHPRVLAAVHDWWDDGRGADLVGLVPRLFFQHFADTSFVVLDEDRLVGFLIGFLSASLPNTAYVHFVGVDPLTRGRGLGRALHERFFDVAATAGRTEIRAITGPQNVRSQDFHRRMGFTVSEPIADYDGSGQDRVDLHLHLTRGGQPNSSTRSSPRTGCAARPSAWPGPWPGE